MIITAFLQGFGLGAGLIIAIGAQNVFVLQQGIMRQHVLLTALICTICDALLIALGVAGLGTLIAANDWLLRIATYGGALFLFGFGLRSFYNAWRLATLDPTTNTLAGATVRATVAAVVGVSLLNPHVYLDTVVLVGSVGGQYSGVARSFFAAGAMAASATWFFALAYGAGWLAPLFARPTTWRILDFAVGCVMWVISFSLVRS